MTCAEKRFKRAVRSLWSRGYYPSPTRLNVLLHDRASDNLGGCQPRWRREVMAELEIPLQRRPRRRAR